MTTKKVCCWDLEGPISIIDFAAEIGKLLNQKTELNLQKYDMGEFFFMISKYDDYIVDIPGVKEKLNILDYQPGDTLRLMAPMYAACFTDEELIKLAKNCLGLLPGCKELMAILQKEWEVFVISTSYTQFAYTVTSALNIPQGHVYCTDFKIKEVRKEVNDIGNAVKILVEQIFQKYLNNDKNLDIVIDDLNEFFWKNEKSDYVKIMNKVRVRGGKNKELAVEDVSKKTRISISEMIALGDSITDISMLQRVNDEGGIAVTFNGNRFSTLHANVAISTPNNFAVLPIFQAKMKIENFLEKWEALYNNFQNNPKNIINGLVSKECKIYFVENNFVPEIFNLRNKSKDQIDEIIKKQERMRKIVRGWAGKLG